jgi:hypothetical protein
VDRYSDFGDPTAIDNEKSHPREWLFRLVRERVANRDQRFAYCNAIQAPVFKGLLGTQNGRATGVQ